MSDVQSGKGTHQHIKLHPFVGVFKFQGDNNGLLFPLKKGVASKVEFIYVLATVVAAQCWW